MADAVDAGALKKYRVTCVETVDVEAVNEEYAQALGESILAGFGGDTMEFDVEELPQEG